MKQSPDAGLRPLKRLFQLMNPAAYSFQPSDIRIQNLKLRAIRVKLPRRPRRGRSQSRDSQTGEPEFQCRFVA